MAETQPTEVETAMNSLQINGDNESSSNEDVLDPFHKQWGFSLDELYKIALRFYKDKEGNAKVLQISYKDKLTLVSYTKQVAHGKYRNDVSPEVGFLDVVGSDRRQAWQVLGDMSKEQAMGEFVKYLDSLCPLFKPYVQAHKAEKDEQERRRIEEEERLKREEEEAERQKLENEARLQQQEERSRQQQQELQIRNALNQQTAIQFRQYAEQQCPGNSEQQEALIKQLQEQHFQQYMQQVYQQQLLHQQQQYQQLQQMQRSKLQEHGQQPNGIVNGEMDVEPRLPVDGYSNLPVGTIVDGHQSSDANDNLEEEEETDNNDLPPIAAASMWTRKDIREFKDSIRKDPDSVIKVGSGETVTVRVPTHEDGTCLFWEFATDSYDIGFGVYFEWTVSPSNQVSVHVSESSDEEDLEDEEGGGGDPKGDIEKGSSNSVKKDNQPPTDEIIPVYRRDCHEEVYCGSHMYPGRGVYLLKFDNSYSLWRSKTLYYRVYYTR